MDLIRPDAEHLAGFVDALQRGWSPSTEHDISAEILEHIARDADDFLVQADDRDPRGRTVTLPDGSHVPRLPGFARWMWDGEFCGSINVRWQPGTAELPPHVLGHIGYSVVPWKRRNGCATEALRLLLLELGDLGLPYVELTTDPGNVASQKVITANGGVLVGEFEKGPQYGGGRGLLYRIPLG
jgi:predicted acetyltransferase